MDTKEVKELTKILNQQLITITEFCNMANISYDTAYTGFKRRAQGLSDKYPELVNIGGGILIIKSSAIEFVKKKEEWKKQKEQIQQEERLHPERKGSIVPLAGC